MAHIQTNTALARIDVVEISGAIDASQSCLTQPAQFHRACLLSFLIFQRREGWHVAQKIQAILPLDTDHLRAQAC
jgi:hypothetical protein